MSPIDVAIPFVAGILLVACPQIFFKQTNGTPADVANKQKKYRVIGYVLLMVAALYFVLTLLRR